MTKRDLDETTKNAAKRAERERYSSTFVVKCEVIKINECKKSNLERLNKTKKIVINKTKRDVNKASTNPAFAELAIAQEAINIVL